MCISNELPRDAEAVCPGPCCENYDKVIFCFLLQIRCSLSLAEYHQSLSLWTLKWVTKLLNYPSNRQWILWCNDKDSKVFNLKRERQRISRRKLSTCPAQTVQKGLSSYERKPGGHEEGFPRMIKQARWRGLEKSYPQGSLKAGSMTITWTAWTWMKTHISRRVVISLTLILFQELC